MFEYSLCKQNAGSDQARALSGTTPSAGPNPQQGCRGPAVSWGPLPGPERAPNPSSIRGFVVGDRAWEIRTVAENLPRGSRTRTVLVPAPQNMGPNRTGQEWGQARPEAQLAQEGCDGHRL